MKKLLFSALLLLFSGTILSQATRRVLIEQKHYLKNGKNLDSVELNITIPKTYKGRQVVNKITYSVSPKFIYMNNEVSYAHFFLNERDLKKIDSILIQIDMTLMDYDLNLAKEHPQFMKLSKRKRKKYLKNTGLYELPKINNQEIFEHISDRDEISLAHAIQNLVENHLTYKSFFGKDLGAKYALKNANGDCTEYADLMIAMCRLNSLPARRVAGCTVKSEGNNLLSNIFKYSSHAWVEIYFTDLGWVPFDPTHSDGSKVTNFENLETKYVYYSYDEKTKRKDSWTWWGSAQFNVKRKTLVSDYAQNTID